MIWDIYKWQTWQYLTVAANVSGFWACQWANASWFWHRFETLHEKSIRIQWQMHLNRMWQFSERFKMLLAGLRHLWREAILKGTEACWHWPTGVLEAVQHKWHVHSCTRVYTVHCRSMRKGINPWLHTTYVQGCVHTYGTRMHAIRIQPFLTQRHLLVSEISLRWCCMTLCSCVHEA